jgi:hypothetical protein
MNLNKASKRDRKINKRRGGQLEDSRSVFVIEQEQKKRAKKIKQERKQKEKRISGEE